MKSVFLFVISLFFCACASISPTGKREPAQSTTGSAPAVCYGIVHVNTLDIDLAKREKIEAQIEEYVKIWRFLTYLETTYSEKGTGIVVQSIFGETRLKHQMMGLTDVINKKFHVRTIHEILGCK